MATGNLEGRASEVLSSFLQQGQRKGIDLNKLEENYKKRSIQLTEWTLLVRGVPSGEVDAILARNSISLPNSLQAAQQPEQQELVSFFLGLADTKTNLRSEFLAAWKATTNKNDADFSKSVQDTRAKEKDKYTVATEGLKYLKDAQNSKKEKIGADGLITADETRDVFIAIQKLDSDKNNIALPVTDNKVADTFTLSGLEEGKETIYQEQVLFSTFIKAQEKEGQSISDVNEGNKDEKNHTLITNIELATNDIPPSLDQPIDQADTNRANSLSNADNNVNPNLIANFQADLAKFKKQYVGLGGPSSSTTLAYSELFMKYVKEFPAPSGTRWLSAQFINNIGGTFTILDPFSPIYSSFYLPGDSPDLVFNQLNQFLSSVYASRVGQLTNDAPSAAESFILGGKEYGNYLLGGSDGEFSIADFDNSIKKYFTDRNLSTPSIITGLRDNLESVKPATWMKAQEAARKYLEQNTSAEGAQELLQALNGDSESAKIAMFIEITTGNLKRLQETLKAKQDGAKAVLDQLQKAFVQPGQRGGGE